MAVWIFLANWCLISSILIYYAPKSDIWVKSYGNMSLPRASVVQFLESRYIICLDRTFESNVVAVCICLVLPCLISTFSIYYAPKLASECKVMTIWIFWERPMFNFERLHILFCPESDIRVKSDGRLNIHCDSMFNFGHLNILCAWIGHPIERFWPFEFLESFRCSISRVSI